MMRHLPRPGSARRPGGPQLSREKPWTNHIFSAEDDARQEASHQWREALSAASRKEKSQLRHRLRDMTLDGDGKQDSGVMHYADSYSTLTPDFQLDMRPDSARGREGSQLGSIDCRGSSGPGGMDSSQPARAQQVGDEAASSIHSELMKELQELVRAESSVCMRHFEDRLQMMQDNLRKWRNLPSLTCAVSSGGPSQTLDGGERSVLNSMDQRIAAVEEAIFRRVDAHDKEEQLNRRIDEACRGSSDMLLATSRRDLYDFETRISSRMHDLQIRVSQVESRRIFEIDGFSEHYKLCARISDVESFKEKLQHVSAALEPLKELESNVANSLESFRGCKEELESNVANALESFRGCKEDIIRLDALCTSKLSQHVHEEHEPKQSEKKEASESALAMVSAAGVLEAMKRSVAETNAFAENFQAPSEAADAAKGEVAPVKAQSEAAEAAKGGGAVTKVLDNMEAEPSKAQLEVKSDQCFYYLPFQVKGILVLQHQGDGYLVDNSLLKNTGLGLGYRKSKKLDDNVGNERALWREVVNGTEEQAEDGMKWLKVKVEVEPAAALSVMATSLAGGTVETKVEEHQHVQQLQQLEQPQLPQQPWRQELQQQQPQQRTQSDPHLPTHPQQPQQQPQPPPLAQPGPQQLVQQLAQRQPQQLQPQQPQQPQQQPQQLQQSQVQRQELQLEQPQIAPSSQQNAAAQSEQRFLEAARIQAALPRPCQEGNYSDEEFEDALDDRVDDKGGAQLPPASLSKPDVGDKDDSAQQIGGHSPTPARVKQTQAVEEDQDVQDFLEKVKTGSC